MGTDYVPLPRFPFIAPRCYVLQRWTTGRKQGGATGVLCDGTPRDERSLECLIVLAYRHRKVRDCSTREAGGVARAPSNTLPEVSGFYPDRSTDHSTHSMPTCKNALPPGLPLLPPICTRPKTGTRPSGIPQLLRVPGLSVLRLLSCPGETGKARLSRKVCRLVRGAREKNPQRKTFARYARLAEGTFPRLLRGAGQPLLTLC